jgi:uracil phosphoribosyltransferase
MEKFINRRSHATGQSIVAVYNKLMERACEIHIAVVIAAQEVCLSQTLTGTLPSLVAS